MSKTQLGILNYLTQLGIPTIQTQSEEEADGRGEFGREADASCSRMLW